MIESLNLSQLVALKPQGGKLYLVGGAVRDILLQKPGKDFDLVCDFDTRKIARAFADSQHGDFYLLDHERNTSRVILPGANETRVFYDFARMHGNDLSEDLAARDFTINAMAIDLDFPGHIIDPLGGASDLMDQILRTCSESAFEDDPVRVIRAVRYAVDLSLNMTVETLSALKAAVPQLYKVSQERNRDEFLKVLDTPKPDIGLELLHRLGILEQIGIASGEGILGAAQSCGTLARLFSELEGIGAKESQQTLQSSSFLLRLGRFKEPLLSYLLASNTSGRTLRTLDLLGIVLNHLSKDVFEKSLLQLALSNEEKSHLVSLFDHKEDLANWKDLPERRSIFKFYKKAPVDVCFLWLADLLAKPAAENSQDLWLSALAICESLVEAWANQPQWLAPSPLLNGKDIMIQFDIPPGRRLGQILEALVEEQAAGAVTTREEAIQWVESNLTPKNLL